MLIASPIVRLNEWHSCGVILPKTGNETSHGIVILELKLSCIYGTIIILLSVVHQMSQSSTMSNQLAEIIFICWIFVTKVLAPSSVQIVMLSHSGINFIENIRTFWIKQMKSNEMNFRRVVILSKTIGNKFTECNFKCGHKLRESCIINDCKIQHLKTYKIQSWCWVSGATYFGCANKQTHVRRFVHVPTLHQYVRCHCICEISEWNLRSVTLPGFILVSPRIPTGWRWHVFVFILINSFSGWTLELFLLVVLFEAYFVISHLRWNISEENTNNVESIALQPTTMCCTSLWTCSIRYLCKFNLCT